MFLVSNFLTWQFLLGKKWKSSANTRKSEKQIVKKLKSEIKKGYYQRIKF
jgi:DNA polymerase III delta subunit